MLHTWRNQPVTKMLYAVVGLMAVLVASELLTLLFAMGILPSIRPLVRDGYEAISALRAMKYKYPVVALTAHAMKEEKSLCLQIGFSEHISKPISKDSLLRMVAKYTLPVSALA